MARVLQSIEGFGLTTTGNLLMLKKQWMAATAFAAVLAFASGHAQAASFVNGNFETGDFTGWEQGSGYWESGGSGTTANYPTYTTGPGGNLTPDLFLGASPYNIGGSGPPGVFTVTNPGTDPNTGGALNMVYSGSHSAKLNDTNNNYSVTAIRQTVANYTDTHIFFAWAAVLEGSHDIPDSDNFTISLIDDTKGSTLYTASYSSASAAGTSLFNTFANNFYTDWQVQNIDLVAAGGALGDTLTLELMGADCPYGGHWGYVYLDGFGAVLPPPGGGDGVPEPASLALLGLGMAGIASLRRKKTAVTT
jgi:hypothetical protein